MGNIFYRYFNDVEDLPSADPAKAAGAYGKVFPGIFCRQNGQETSKHMAEAPGLRRKVEIVVAVGGETMSHTLGNTDTAAFQTLDLFRVVGQ